MNQLQSIQLVKSNNQFGQHEFHVFCDDVDTVEKDLLKCKWVKTPKIVKFKSKLIVFCFNNYDKATFEREFSVE